MVLSSRGLDDRQSRAWLRVKGYRLRGKGYGLRVKPLPAEAGFPVKRGHLRVKGGVTNCQFFGINCQFFAKWGSFWCKRA